MTPERAKELWAMRRDDGSIPRDYSTSGMPSLPVFNGMSQKENDFV